MTAVFLLTFNCAKLDQLPSIHAILNDSLPGEAPQLLVFGFQELLPLLPSLAYETVSSTLEQFETLILGQIKSKYSGSWFASESAHAGAIGLFVVSREKLLVSTATLSTGVLYSSLKGGCGLRFKFQDEEFTIVTAHLAANEGYAAIRVAESTKLLRELDFGDGFGVMKPDTHTFVMGDLNFRAVRYAEDSRGLLNELDELKQLMNNGSCFHGFEEAQVNFKPTYKYHVGTQNYNRKRTPSWCDRVLYLKSEVDVVKYDSVRTIMSSDHQPVFLHIKIKSKPSVVTGNTVLSQNGDRVDVSLEANSAHHYMTLLGDLVVWTALTGWTTRLGQVISGGVIILLLFLVTR